VIAIATAPAQRLDSTGRLFFSISTSTLSPGFIKSGGFRDTPTPDGVPVTMMSPLRNVIASLMVATRVATSNTMSLVEAL